MINYKYQLNSPRKIVKKVFDEDIKDKVVIKPTYMSICAADQRYFQGLRDPKILEKKLPMALIHEAVGEVLFDTKNFKKGEKVILVPNITKTSNKELSNYDTKSKFMSSSTDGFMQEKIMINEDQLVKYDGIEDEVAVFCELLSVAIHAVNAISSKLDEAKHVGIWGDGNLGYLTHLYLAKKYPKLKLYIFGKSDEKLEMFGLAYKRINIVRDSLPSIDIAIEAVGGNASSKAINHIIDCINPLGIIVLLGVSEESVLINTRMILEKGLTLIGRSRSSILDFIEAKNFLLDNNNRNSIKKIISKIFNINHETQIEEAFDYDFTHPWKTIIKWEL